MSATGGAERWVPSDPGAAVSSTTVGVVVIGRNEGDRLKRCLNSVIRHARRIVYVDSGSTDGSVAWAREHGVEVLELDMNVPFTMARGRNAGWRHLVRDGDISLIQFVDGDCEVVEGWIETAVDALEARPDVVAVCGRRRERSPDATLYNALTDLEWATDPGETHAFGGDVMIRREAIEAVGGFNEAMIAGEEPELSVRLRADGGRIVRLVAEMTRHDAAMTRFGQWWRRARRAGHAYAEGASLHGNGPYRHNVRQLRSAWLWGLTLPALAVAGAAAALLLGPIWWTLPAVVLGLLAVQTMRIASRRRRAGVSKLAFVYAVFCMIAKPAQAIGALEFRVNRMLGRRRKLIEYKTSESTAPKA